MRLGDHLLQLREHEIIMFDFQYTLPIYISNLQHTLPPLLPP